MHTCTYHWSRDIGGVNLLGLQLPSAVRDGLGPLHGGGGSGRGPGFLVASQSQEALTTGRPGKFYLLWGGSFYYSFLLLFLWF